MLRLLLPALLLATNTAATDIVVKGQVVCDNMKPDRGEAKEYNITVKLWEDDPASDDLVMELNGKDPWDGHKVTFRLFGRLDDPVYMNEKTTEPYIEIIHHCGKSNTMYGSEEEMSICIRLPDMPNNNKDKPYHAEFDLGTFELVHSYWPSHHHPKPHYYLKEDRDAYDVCRSMLSHDDCVKIQPPRKFNPPLQMVACNKLP